MQLDASDKEKLDDIHRVLIGNEKMRQKGLIERVEILETDKEKRGARNARIIGIASGISLSAGYITSAVMEWYEKTFK